MAERMSASLTVRTDDAVLQRDPDRHGAGLEVAGQPVGHRRLDVDRHDAARRQRGAHGGRRLGLDPDHAHARSLEAEDDAREQPAPAAGDDDGAQVRHLLEELTGERRLPGDDVGVVVGGHVPAPVARRQLERVGLRLAVALAVQDEAHVELLEGRDLGRRGAGGHHDGDLGTELGRRVGQAEPVVARRRGDDGAAGLLLERGRHRGQAAAHLERARRLERLELGRHGRAELGRADGGRHGQEAAHRLPRRLHVGRSREHHVAHRTSLAEARLAC